MRPIQVAWERPATAVRFASPVNWAQANLSAGSVKVLLSDPVQVPRSEGTAQVFHRDADWDGNQLRLHAGATPHYEFHLGLPTGAKVLEAFIADQNATATPSDKAVQITGVLNAVSDPDALCTVTAAGAIKALTASNSRDIKRLLGEQEGDADARLGAVMAALAPRTGLMFDAIWAKIRRGTTKEDLSATLDVLVREGLAHRGVQTACRSCGLTLFLPFSDVGARPRCGGCVQDARLTGGGIGEPGIYYRLGHLGLQLSHNGGVVPLAATRRLTREGSFVMPGANITLAGTSSGEFDLLGWAGTSVFAGEAKSSAAGFASYDFGRDTARAVALGAHEYIVACGEPMTKDSLSSARSACEASGLALRALGPVELFESVT